MINFRLNLKKVVAVTICLAGSATMFAQSKSITTDEGVVINGVKWATRNVDEFRTFAENPESVGKFYQCIGVVRRTTATAIAPTAWSYASTTST